MSEIAHLAATIFKRAGKAKRFIVAIAGPPGAGKSTLSAGLHDLLPEGAVEVVPMDGFHYDDIVLNARGLRARKGAPETFDFAGFETLLKRIRAGEPDIAIPVFDRSIELSRAAAAIVSADTKFILVEGNYLLLDEAPWNAVAPLLDACWYVEVDDALRRARLVRRHEQFGRSAQAARDWEAATDEPNARRIAATRARASLVVAWGD